MNKPREQEALSAYLKILQNKGATDINLERRKQFVEKLIPAIEQLPLDGFRYREAVDSILHTFDVVEWPFFLSVIREYYHFWCQDFKAITNIHRDTEYELEPSQWTPEPANLKALWEQLDTEKFTTVENWPIKAYIHALRQAGAEQSLVDTRVKLVKLLIVRMRTAPELNNKFYRLTVDTTIQLFKVKDTRDLFLAVVREFFYFWIGDPEAQNYLFSDKLFSIL